MNANRQTKSDGAYGNFTIGLLFIVFGAIALIATLADIHIVWSAVWKLWPAILIVCGICALPINKVLKSTLVVIAAIGACLLYQNQVSGSSKSYSYGDRHNNAMKSNAKIQEFSEPYSHNVKYAEFDLSYGAGVVALAEPTDELVAVTNESNYINQSFNVKYNDDRAKIEVESEGKSKRGDRRGNKCNIFLNENPEWQISLEVGAVDANLDLSSYKVSKVTVEGGACDIDMKIGTLQQDTKIDIETGVSNIVIRLPESAACKIMSETVLADKNFKGFNKRGKGLYLSDNYGNAYQNIEIELDGAVSDITVEWY